MVTLDKSQKEILKAAAEFAKGEFEKDLAIDMEKENAFPRKIWEKAAELGFIGIHLPEAYGGGGLGMLENILVAEAFCRKDSSIGCALMMSGYAGECLARFGDKVLKENHLTGIAEGRLICGGAFLEKGLSMTDEKLATTADRQGDSWVLSGEKTHVINGGLADGYLVLARTAEGTSLLLVDAAADGIAVTDGGRKLGLNMMPLAEVAFDNVCVAGGRLVGKEGKGMQQRLAFADQSRLMIAGQALGIAAGAMDRAIDYIKQREQFGRKLGQFEITRHKIAEMAIHLEQARAFAYQAAAEFDNSRKPDGARTAMAKAIAVRAALAVADEAIQLHGGYGYMTEYDVERFFRDAKALDALEGGRSGLLDTIGADAIGRIR